MEHGPCSAVVDGTLLGSERARKILSGSEMKQAGLSDSSTEILPPKYGPVNTCITELFAKHLNVFALTNQK